MTRRLENKVAVITGGNSVIGLATAKEFAGQGAQVVLLARSQDKFDKAISKIGHNATGSQPPSAFWERREVVLNAHALF